MCINKLNDNYFRQITAIYPLYVILLILIPFVAGLFINYDLFDTRELLISLIWIPFFTIPYCLFKRKFFYYLTVIICFLNGFVNLAHWILVKGPITAASLFVFFSTNYQESIDFLALKKNYNFLLLIPYLFVFILAIRFPAKIFPVKSKNYIFSLIGLISIAFVIENAFHHRLIRKGVPVLVKSTISFYKEIKAYKELNNINTDNLKNIKAVSAEVNCKQLFVLIIGESANRNHMSLYGYSKQTTPKLQSLNNIIVYDNVVSAYSNTLNSILSSLTQANLENKMDYSKSISLIDIYRTAGFKTYWISNQSPIGIWDNLITLFAQKADVKIFANISSNSSFESTYTASYDDKLLPLLNNYINKKEKCKFIILHLMGSHSSYSKRYPSNFEKFKDISTEKFRTISEYDNSIYFNDFVVDSLIKIVKLFSQKNNAVSALIYLSDHGENVYDENNNTGHDYAQYLSKNNVEIPFLVWLSPKYKEIFYERSEIIKANIHKPFVTDDFFHASIDLFNIKTPLLENERSIFNNAFNEKRKRILVDGKDYDKK